MEKLTLKATKFFFDKHETIADFQEKSNDEMETVKKLVNAIQLSNDDTSYEYKIEHAIHIICKHYEKKPEFKNIPSLLNFLCNCICDLVTTEFIKYDDKCETLKGYIQMMKHVDKFGKMIEKHMEVFDKNESSTLLGGCYIVYCNLAMMLMCIFFPDYVTLYQHCENETMTLYKRYGDFERYLTFAQIKKRDICVKLYFDNQINSIEY